MANQFWSSLVIVGFTNNVYIKILAKNFTFCGSSQGFMKYAIIKISKPEYSWMIFFQFSIQGYLKHLCTIPFFHHPWYLCISRCFHRRRQFNLSQIDFCLTGSWFLSGPYGIWSFKKMPLFRLLIFQENVSINLTFLLESCIFDYWLL